MAYRLNYADKTYCDMCDEFHENVTIVNVESRKRRMQSQFLFHVCKGCLEKVQQWSEQLNFPAHMP